MSVAAAGPAPSPAVSPRTEAAAALGAEREVSSGGQAGGAAAAVARSPREPRGSAGARLPPAFHPSGRGPRAAARGPAPAPILPLAPAPFEARTRTRRPEARGPPAAPRPPPGRREVTHAPQRPRARASLRAEAGPGLRRSPRADPVRARSPSPERGRGLAPAPGSALRRRPRCRRAGGPERCVCRGSARRSPVPAPAGPPGISRSRACTGRSQNRAQELRKVRERYRAGRRLSRVNWDKTPCAAGSSLAIRKSGEGVRFF